MNKRLGLILLIFALLVMPISFAMDVIITPSAPVDDDSLFCYFDGSSSPYFDYMWHRNGVSTIYNVPTVPASATSVGDTWTCYINLFGNNVGYASVNIDPNPNPDSYPQTTLSVTPQNGLVPLNVNAFCSRTSGDSPVTLNLDFGDGTEYSTTTSSLNKAHTYTNSGTYTVTCSAVDTDGDTDEETRSVAVLADSVPDAHCSATPNTGFAPLSVSFSGWSTGGNGQIDYSWTFGDGGSTDSPNIVYTFYNSGSYAATLTVTDDDGDTDTCTQVITVTADITPVATILASQTSGMAPLSVNLQCKGLPGNAPTEFRLDYGDGSAQTVAGSPISEWHTYSAGTYNPTCTLTDSDGDSDSDSVTITATADLQPTVSFSATPLSGLEPLTTHFTCSRTGGNTPVTLTLEYGDSTQVSTTQSSISKSHTYAAGTYTAKCTAVDIDGDTDYLTKTINVGDDTQPVLSCNANPTTGFAPLSVTFSGTATGGNGILSYRWVFGDGSVAFSAHTQHTYTQAGTYSATLTVTDDDGDIDTCTKQISVSADMYPSASIDATPQSGLAPLNVRLDCEGLAGNAPSTFKIDFGDGTTPETRSDQFSTYHTYTNAGNYEATCTITDNDGDWDKDNVVIQVGADYDVSTTCSATPTTGIAPLTVQFNGQYSGGNTPVSSGWDFGDGYTSSINSPAHTYATGGVYYAEYTATDSDGDSDTCTKQIQVIDNSAPIVDIDVSPNSGLAPLSVGATCSRAGGNNPVLLKLNFGDGTVYQTESTSITRTHTYPNVGFYQVSCSAQDLDGDVDVESEIVHVIEDDEPEAYCDAIPTSGYAPLSVTFTGYSNGGNGPVEYSWIFGDGGSTDSPNVVYTYHNPGTYTATLTVTDTDGDTDVCKKYINVGEDTVPSVSLTMIPTSGMEPLISSYHCSYTGGNEPVSLFINFGDGTSTTGAGTLSGSHTYDTSGDYTATCTARDNDADVDHDSELIHVGEDLLPNVVLSATPTSGLSPLSVNFNCGGFPGNTPATYRLDFDDGTYAMESNNPITISHTYAQGGDYDAICSITDNDGDYDSKGKRITVKSDSEPTAYCDADPVSGYAPLSVTFSGYALGGNTPIEYSWIFGDGGSTDSANVIYTYYNSGAYTATLTVTDSDGDTDTCTKQITVSSDDTPTAVFSANPTSGRVPLDVDFYCGGTGGNGPLDYAIDYGDGLSEGMGHAFSSTHTYSNEGTYYTSCTVTDIDGDSDTTTIRITATQPVLNVTDITCFDRVIIDNNQSCSVYVEDEDGTPVENALVKIYYDDGSLYGACYTDRISGGCESKDLQDVLGYHTVFATAEHPDYVDDTDNTPEFTYEVWQHKYDIVDLRVYNDPSFNNEDYDFFRGEDMYVKFRIVDTNNPNSGYISDMVTQATLVSPPGGRADLTKMYENEWYHYKLTPIPATHDFLGLSQVFTFAFNFSDHSGGQAQVDLTIRNNPPVITPEIQSTSIYENETATFYLYQHEHDLEDSGNDLSWSVTYSTSNVQVTLNNKVTQVKGLAPGQGYFDVKLQDLDYDYDTQRVYVNVIEIVDLVPEAHLSIDSQYGEAPHTTSMSCTGTGGDAPLRYRLEFGDGTDTGLQYSPIYTTHAYATAGDYHVYCRVWDNDGDNDSEGKLVKVSQDTDPVAHCEAHPTSGYAPLDVTFSGYATGGEAPIEYSWILGDGGSTDSPNVIYTYYNSGVYTATLTVTDSDGDTDTCTKIINVGHDSEPLSEFTMDPTNGMEPLTTAYYCGGSSGNGVLSYSLDFDDGNILTSSGTALSGTHVYEDAGEYRARCTVEDEDGDDDMQRITVTVTEDLKPNVQFTITPTSGLEPLVTQVYCGGYEGNGPSVFTLDFQDGSPIIESSNAIVTQHTYSAGNYKAKCSIRDNDGDYDYENIQVEVTGDSEPSVSCSATPMSGYAPLEVSFRALTTDGNAPIEFSWIFGDGGSTDSPIVMYTYENSGVYTATVTATDSDGDTDTCTKTITVGDDLKPDAFFTANPTSGDVPLDVDFYCGGTEGNGQNTYSLDFGDGSPVEEDDQPLSRAHTYTSAGAFEATCTIIDSDFDMDSESITIAADLPVLNVTDITCFDRVIVGGNQSCSVYVKDNDGNAVDNALVSIYYIVDNAGHTELFGTCYTDRISGGCETKDIQTDVGNRLVFANAQKDGYEPDTDMYPLFHYEVWQHKYDIMDLKVYNDESFTTEDYDFFRGENMYVKFRVVDANNPDAGYISEMVTEAVLVSPPGGRAELTKMDENTWYYYKLTPIPATHDFLGLSQVFTFAFNFSDHSGGQAQVDLTIRNNPPVITPTIDNVEMLDNEVKTIDLSGHEYDVEDSGRTLTWTLQNVNGDIDVTLNNKIITIVPRDSGNGVFEVVLADLDLDTDSQLVSVNVNVSNIAPVADAGPDQTVHVDETVQFSGSGSYDPMGEIVSYDWNFGDGSSGQGITPVHTYTQEGTFTVTLTVVDDGGMSDSDQMTLTVTKKPIGVYIIAEPRQGPAPLKVNFMAIGQGRAPIEYYWDYGDGESGFGDIVYHTYENKGVYTVTVTAKDADGDTAQATTSIVVGADDRLDSMARRRFYIGQVQVLNDDKIQAGEELKVIVDVENTGNTRTDDLKITAYINDFGERVRFGPIRLHSGESTSRILVLDVPAWAAPGVYDLRVTVSDDTTSRTKYRDIVIV